MNAIFMIEDEFHCETLGEFQSRELALEELRRIAKLPYGRRPNAAPCTSSATCHREYWIVECDEGREVRRDLVFRSSAEGTEWVADA